MKINNIFRKSLVRFACVVNGKSYDFDTKSELDTFLAHYRLNENEISELSIFKIKFIPLT